MPTPTCVTGMYKYSHRHGGLTSFQRTFIVGFNATSITSAAIEINRRFGISDEHFPNSFWPVTSWTVGAALAPMVILPIMEDFGMKVGYLVSRSWTRIFV